MRLIPSCPRLRLPLLCSEEVRPLTPDPEPELEPKIPTDEDTEPRAGKRKRVTWAETLDDSVDYRSKRFDQDPVYTCDGSIPCDSKAFDEADNNEREEGELTPS